MSCLSVLFVSLNCVCREREENRARKVGEFGFSAVGILSSLEWVKFSCGWVTGGPVQEFHLLCEKLWTFEPSV